MTRENDVYLSISERYTFANKIQNEVVDKKVLFISIHINSGADKITSRGIEVLYYDHTSTTLHKYYQNGQILYEEKVRYKNQSAYLDKSTKTKKIIEKLKVILEKQGFLLRNPFDNKQNSGVCRETTMPSILIECGFINNSEDRNLMLDENYQYKLANTIKSAIDEYFKEELQ